MLIEQIQVKGYKSLVDATLHVKPLTLLAGTNSSGKSSIMQPLLLIKQTMEAPYQPAGALAETAEELVTRISGIRSNVFSISFNGCNVFSAVKNKITLEFSYKVSGSGFIYEYQKSVQPKQGEVIITPDLLITPFIFLGYEKETIRVVSENVFLGLKVRNSENPQAGEAGFRPTFILEDTLPTVMHIPGLRVTPKRSYPIAFSQNKIKGTFDLYAAGTISQWQQQKNTNSLIQLNNCLLRLGLTDSVTADEKNANEVELSVSRLPAGTKGKTKKSDMVNIADVGIGVSQVLPILVALIAAQEGQIVYVEQPELHLHPRAQVAMAELLAEAANRGVRVIVETHSSLLLLTIQTLIAQEKIKNTDVALHWFVRDAKGATQVTYVQPDEDGAYGEWPEDFGDVELKAQDAYLTAVGMRHFGKAAQ
jgi:hypothetical protein